MEENVEEQTPSKRDPTPLPLKKLTVICCIILSESFSITMIFPFIAIMVSDFGVAGSEAELGFYAGLVASTFNFAQFLSAFLWGMAADRIGRRPILLLGLLGNFITILLFGFSPTLWWAIMSRSLNGILNGNIGVAKCYLLEISDDSNSAKAFSTLGLTYGVGVVIGPAIGGFLSRPHEKAPNIFPPGSFWEEFPYFLPCLVSALTNLVGLIMGWFVLTETLQSKIVKSDESLPLLRKEKKKVTDGVTLDSELEQSNQSKIVKSDESLPLLRIEKKKVTYEGVTLDSELEQSNQSKIVKFDESLPLLRKEKVTDEVVTLDSELEQSKGTVESPKLMWIRAIRGVWISATLYGILAFATIAIEEIFSVWSVNSVELGGLKFNSEQVGIMFIVSGIALGITQIFFCPFVIDKFGALRSFQVLTFFYIPFTVFIPFLNLLTPYGSTIVTVVCGILFAIRSALDVVIFTCVFMFVNHSVEPNLVGTANGIAQSSASLCRGFGPLLGGIMLTWSLSNGIGFPFDHYFTFFVMGFFMLIMLVISFLLTPAINSRMSK